MILTTAQIAILDILKTEIIDGNMESTFTITEAVAVTGNTAVEVQEALQAGVTDGFITVSAGNYTLDTTINYLFESQKEALCKDIMTNCATPIEFSYLQCILSNGFSGLEQYATDLSLLSCVVQSVADSANDYSELNGSLGRLKNIINVIRVNAGAE